MDLDLLFGRFRLKLVALPEWGYHGVQELECVLNRPLDSAETALSSD